MSLRILYLQGPTALLNPDYDKRRIEAAYQADAEIAAAEYGGLFRSDVSAYLSDEVIDAALCSGDRSRPRLPEFEYVGFIDAAGGGGSDAMTCAVAHSEVAGRVVLDQLLAIEPPFDTEAAVERCALVLKSFGITSAKADKYAGLWPAQSFQRHGIALVASELDKSAIYREVAPLFVSRLVTLLDDVRLEVELRQLERTPRSGGRPDAIDHAPGRGAHDDRINAAAGALLAASKLAWSGRSSEALGVNRSLHLSGLDYSPFDRYAREVERANDITNSRRPHEPRH
jgi:hypothetical protein